MNETFESLVGSRLREEREALGLTQAEVADLVGVTREQWGRYERGVGVPGGTPLAALTHAGGDLVYVLTGVRQEVSAREQALLRAFRAIDEAGRSSIEHLAAALAGVAAREPPPKATHLTTFHGEVGAVHTVHEGSMSVTHESPPKRGRNPPRG